MASPEYRVVARLPFHDRHTSSECVDLVHVEARERSDAEVVAQALRAQGWEVEIRKWTRRQRRAQDRLGRWRWHAGYVEFRA